MASNRLKLNDKKTELLYLQSCFGKTLDQPTSMTIGNDIVPFSRSLVALIGVLDWVTNCGLRILGVLDRGP